MPPVPFLGIRKAFGLVMCVIKFMELFLKESSPPSRREGFPGGSDGKESACDAGDPGLIPGLGRCPEEGNGYRLQYSCLENFMDRGAWWATVSGAARVSHD